MESFAAACNIRPTAHASPYHALSMGIVVRLIVRKLSCGPRYKKTTNKQTPLKTSTSLRYATPVDNNSDAMCKRSAMYRYCTTCIIAHAVNRSVTLPAFLLITSRFHATTTIIKILLDAHRRRKINRSARKRFIIGRWRRRRLLAR